MKNLTCCLLCILFFISCQEEKPLIDQQQMANILTDLHMAETYAQLIPTDKGGFMTKNQDTLEILYSHIYKKYDLDTASFNKALNWYKERPKLFDKVYEKTLAELSIRKDTYTDSILEYSDSTEVNIKDTLKD